MPGDAVGDVFETYSASFRKTRSGKSFSPWKTLDTFSPAPHAQVDFDQLLFESIIAEHEATDSTEGYPFDPMTPALNPILMEYSPFSSPTPLTPPPLSPTLAPTELIPPISLTPPVLALPPPSFKPHRDGAGIKLDRKPGNPSAEAIYRKLKGKRRAKLKKQLQKDAAPHGYYAVKPNTVNKHIRGAKPQRTLLNTEDMSHARTAYLGSREECVMKTVFGLEEMVGAGSEYGFELKKWDGRTATPLLDNMGRTIGICAGCPDDPTWGGVHLAAAAEMEDASKKCRFPHDAVHHRRGPFPALAAGVSFGGGQKVPGNLVNNAINAAILYSLLSNIAFIRIAGFASGVFATWAPRLYHYYVQHLGPLFKSYPRLHRNFLNSVFACATFNFGPQTCCFPHKDSGNLSFGWCAITALGKFDPTCGGHLILWDLKLVIEFPPGSTILIPSATIRHSNIAIRPHETRYSFTQYTAGGLFRWVDHGYQTEASYQAGWSKGRKAEEEETNGRRWAEGVKMFSTFDELHAMHSAL